MAEKSQRDLEDTELLEQVFRDVTPLPGRVIKRNVLRRRPRFPDHLGLGRRTPTLRPKRQTIIYLKSTMKSRRGWIIVPPVGSNVA